MNKVSEECETVTTSESRLIDRIMEHVCESIRSYPTMHYALMSAEQRKELKARLRQYYHRMRKEARRKSRDGKRQGRSVRGGSRVSPKHRKLNSRELEIRYRRKRTLAKALRQKLSVRISGESVASDMCVVVLPKTIQ